MIIRSFEAQSKSGYFLENQEAASIRPKEEQERKTIYAGGLGLRQDETSLQKIQAQRKALRTIMDTFQQGLRTDEGMQELNSNIHAFNEDAVQNRKEYDYVAGLQEGLKEAYGIAGDSKEHSDLQLMQKERAYRREGRSYELTEEEKNQLASMGPETAYQKQALGYDEMMDVYQKRAEDAVNAGNSMKKAVMHIKTELLKSDPMVESAEQAEQTLLDASMKTAMEEFQEVKEKQEEEQEERQEDIKEGQSEPEVSDLIHKMLEEDIKGIAVDQMV